MAKLELVSPTKPFWLTQKFGINGDFYKKNGINIDGHNGLDLLSAHGQPVYAAHDGIAFYQVDSGQGHGVVVITDKPYDYKGKLAFFKTVYWHLCDPKKDKKFTSPVYTAVGVNTSKSIAVKAGDLIGYADNTGLSTGDHLHFGLKPVVAGKAPKSGDAPDLNIGAWKNMEQDNGYLGSIDPMPYFQKSDKPTFDGTFVSLQKCLKYEGLFPDGVAFYENYGPVTKRGVIEFQKKYSIWPPWGNFGPLTKAKIRSLYP